MHAIVDASLNDREPGAIGAGGAILIWALSIALYGGGLFAWFFAVDRIQRHVGWTQSQEYPPPAPWTEEPYEDKSQATEPEIESQAATSVGRLLGNLANAKKEKEAEAANVQVLWPLIHIQGTMAGKGGAGAALLDGIVVDVGSSYNNAKVVSVDKKTVTLEHDGEVKTFFTGSVTREP